MGTVSGPYSSLSLFADDWLFNLTVIVLIQLGGLGFLVWSDVLENGIRPKYWNLHTKLVLFVNAFLVFSGTLLLFFLEREGTFSARLLHALFGSITPRTAGFNTVDTAALSGGGKLLTIVLMFIGGSPGSTAGGIKTTTVAVMILFAYSQARRARSVSVFGRSIRKDALEKATAVFFYNLTLAVTGAVLIMLIQPLPLEDVLFETFSAIDTVGMTTGITRDLLPLSRILIALLMYLGRVGSTSFAIALVERGTRPVLDFPPEDILVG
jgi:trk system potassium uptake protein TrkH